MAFSTFGITAAIVQSDALPNHTLNATSSPTDTRVAQLINRRAARVSGLVDQRGIDASALDAAGEPTAFYACQRLVLVGAAIDVALAFTGRAPDDGLVAAWRQEWREGIEALSGPGAKAFLGDALTRATATGLSPRTHIQHGSDTPSGSADVEIDVPAFLRDMDL
mgnify:CR=1 FL=1